MDKKEFTSRVERLTEIGSALGKIPAEIRPAAFELLKDYVTDGDKAPPSKRSPGRGSAATDTGDVDADAFFAKFTHEKPSDNLRSLAAFLFSQYGNAPFATEELQDLATRVGLTIPERPDMTLEQATCDGKKLFTRASRGKFRPTVHGEAYFRKTYQVQKGTKQRPATAE